MDRSAPAAGAPNGRPEPDPADPGRRRVPGPRRAAGGVGDRRGPGRRSARRRHPVLRVLTLAVAALVLAVGGAGAYFYHRLDGNLRTDDLNRATAGSERQDAFGRTPINVLVIGSDARQDARDCALGGACATASGARADVEMVLHISADRSNATVMSIPRDLETALPACTDTGTGRRLVGPRTGMINSALNYGPDCQVAAVHRLTGIPIDHFVMVDFAGVVAMSDAVGGVDVCVNHDVYDPQSHLKLARGHHTLVGVAALEFLRTRHGFGDGSDNVGRTGGQHAFLSATAAKLKSAGTVTDPVKVVHLADAATKALTVDTGLGSVSRLVGLARDFNRVPSDRITFTTMQNRDDPAAPGRVLPGPVAPALFRAIADDRSLTPSGGGRTGASPTAPGVERSRVVIAVRNGTSTPHRASDILRRLTGDGFGSASTAGNASAPAGTTTLAYPAGRSAQARAVAAALGLPASRLAPGSTDGIVLTVGADWPSGTVYPGGHAAGDAGQALAGALHSNGGATGCVRVSTQLTIPISASRGITPQQAYADHPEVKDSAP